MLVVPPSGENFRRLILRLARACSNRLWSPYTHRGRGGRSSYTVVLTLQRLEHKVDDLTRQFSGG